MPATRLYKWTQISGWEIGVALRQGQLRVICAHPHCSRVSVFGARLAHDQVWLWVLARRMRCKACGHLGAQFEIWSQSSPNLPPSGGSPREVREVPAKPG